MEKEELFDFIEKMVAEAYTIGYHHGWNISRPIPKRENDGWGEYSTKIKNRVTDYINQK